jgi:hypothetical protein
MARKLTAWNRHVMKTFKKNKKKGFSAALRAAKKTYRKTKKKKK